MQTTGDVLLCATQGCSQRAYELTLSGRMACRDCADYMAIGSEDVSIRAEIKKLVRRMLNKRVSWR